MTFKSDAKFNEKLTCCLENEMRSLANFRQSTWKCQNWNFDGILLPKVENAWIYELCVMTVKNDTKTEVELTCHFKIYMRNFTDFDTSTQNSKKFVFYLAPCDQSIYCLRYKSTEELYFTTLKKYANFEEKLTCGLKEELRKFSPEHLKVSKLGLWWDPFVQSRGSMALKFAEELWQWRIMQNLNTIWLNISKLTWGI